MEKIEWELVRWEQNSFMFPPTEIWENLPQKTQQKSLSNQQFRIQQQQQKKRTQKNNNPYIVHCWIRIEQNKP